MFLSRLPADHRERRLALATVLTSAVFFVAVAPFATVQLASVPAFVPVYQSALVVNDLVTAVLLYGLFGALRTRAVLVLASGYLFAACLAMVHLLTFPGLFSADGLLGAGAQTTAWLYMAWHGGFPLLVVAYAWLASRAQEPMRKATPAASAILGSVAAVILVAGALTWLATRQAALPAIMQGNHYTPAMLGVVSSVWAASFIALAVLWRRRTRSVLDLWLIVVMCAWIFDIALSAVLNAGRFDLGFYAGRVYGLLASSFLLLVLLIENAMLHGRLAEARHKHLRRLDILYEIDRAVAAEQSPAVIAAAVIQPLRELLEVPRAVVNIFDLAAGEAEWLAAAGRRRVHVGPGVRYSMRLMGDVEALKRGEPQRIDTRDLPPGPEVDALLASGVHAYMAVPMIAGGELIGAVSFGGESREFPAEQTRIAQEVATQLAIAVAQKRLYDRVKHEAESLEERVRERTAELEAANRELDAFSYSVSHDLRAPLRAVDGYARMLDEDCGERLDAEGKRLLGVVRSSSRQMALLIDDLLAFSRLGREPLRTAPLQLDELVRQVIDETRSERDGRAVNFVVGDLGLVDADPALLKQALANLIANAVKFTRERNPAVIEINRESEPHTGGNSHYYVRDNGVGFDMKYYDKLFGVFQRLHSSAEYPGTGVGLAIVQRVVQRHGGRVWADSTPGEGATFRFTLGQDRAQATGGSGGAPA